MNKHYYNSKFEMCEIAEPVIPNDKFNINDFGGKSDGTSMNTLAFKTAIEACSKAGGGSIIVPKGKWLTGAIHLKSNIKLVIEKDAVLIFSKLFHDYLPVVFTRWEGVECYNYSPLIYAVNCENVAITGQGTLTGNGEAWWHWKKLQHVGAQKLYDAEFNKVQVKDRVFGTDVDALRPAFIQMANCKNVLIENITIKDGPFWTIHPIYCENLIVRNLTVLSYGPNTDGINPDSCKNVLVENCYLETGDDCITIKSGINEDGWRVGKPCENIIVRNCTMKEGHGGVVIGSEMSGGIKNVYVHDCKIIGGERGIRIKSMRGRGSYVKNVWYENVQINNVRDEAIHVNMFYESTTIQPKSKTPPEFENINIKNISGEGANIAVAIYGLQESLIKNVTLENIDLKAKQGLICNDIDKISINGLNIKVTDKPQSSLKNIKDADFQNIEISK